VKIKIFFILALLFLFFVKKVDAVITFTISNPTVDSNDVIEVEASLAGLTSSQNCSTSGCYLQAELKILDESKGYFGYTSNNSGEFVDYFSLASSADEVKSKLFNFVPSPSGTWSGKLKAKNNFTDSNYKGPGQYAIRFRRFTGNSISATDGDSNALTINLSLALPTPTPGPTNTPTPNPTSTPTPAPASTNTPTPTKTLTIAPIHTQMPTSSENLSTAVLGETTQEGGYSLPTDMNSINSTPIPDKTVSTKSNQFQKISIFVGIVFLIACAILMFRVIKKGGLTQNEEE
jgi:hypothetical protein